MDKFEEELNDLDQMGEEEKSKHLEELKGECICPICPSYTECAEKADESIFCIIGKSNKCIEIERGCMCSSCPFLEKFGIGVKYQFYCIRDSEMKQRSE